MNCVQLSSHIDENLTINIAWNHTKNTNNKQVTYLVHIWVKRNYFYLINLCFGLRKEPLLGWLVVYKVLKVYLVYMGDWSAKYIYL